MKIAIVGGGPSGLYLAILLKRRRPDFHVTVLEQNSADSTFGFGVVLADSGLNRIQEADPRVYALLVEHMNFNGAQTIKVKEEAIELKHPAKGGAIARITLLHLLQQEAAALGTDIRYGVRIEHPRELEALGPGDADVVVGADGVNSAVRTAFETEFGTTRESLTNHFAWFGTSREFERSALVFRQWEGGSFVAHYYPYGKNASTFVAECDHATWEKLGMDSMSNEQRQALFERVFAPELQGAPLVSNNSNWRQFPVIRSAGWTCGPHVLIGDAQTSAHFSIGSGTRIAMEDAIALAEALTAPGDSTPLQRLDTFVQARGPEKAKLLGASRKSYLWYEEFGDWMRRCTPLQFVHAFMTRTGRLDEARLAAQYPDLFAQLAHAGLVDAAPVQHQRAKTSASGRATQ